MATKPTVRIPLWASTGTKTDPGGSKEAAGWLIDERPPANWWNWVWNAIGQWLGWAEDSVDEIEASISGLNTRVAKVLGTITTGGASPTIDWDPYSEISSTGYSGVAAVINLGGTFNNIDQMVGFANVQSSGDSYSTSVTMVDTNTIWIVARNISSHAQVDLSSTALVISFALFGTPYTT